MPLAKRIIPCLDVDKGRIVKGVNFVDIRDAGDPVEASIRYNDQGADELVILDITASHERRKTIYDTVQAVAENIFIPLTVGGGIHSEQDVYRLLRSGADKISINSAAITNPNLVYEASRQFGSQCIVVAIDAKATGSNNNHWELFTHGGRKATGINAVEWAKKMQDLGAGEILLTSMDRDGTKTGFNIAMTRALVDALTIPVIASGGVGNLQHLVDGIIEGHAEAVLAASIFHFGEYTIAQAKQYMSDNGIEVRL